MSQKAGKFVSELEQNAGLIKKKRQGFGDPSLINALKFSTVCPQKDPESKIKNFANRQVIKLIKTRLKIIRLILSI